MFNLLSEISSEFLRLIETASLEFNNNKIIAFLLLFIINEELWTHLLHFITDWYSNLG